MANDARFHPLVEGTSAAILVYDSDRILQINPACRDLTGRPARELLDQTFPSLLHPRFRPRYEGASAKTLAGREHVQILRRDGSPRWVDLSVRPILFRGSPAILATVVDIHDLKEADLARRDAEVQLKLVQRAGRTVSWDWRVDTDQLTVYGLPRNLVTHGAPAFSSTGKAFFSKLRSEDLVQLKQAVRRSLREHEPLFVEVCLLDPGGQPRWLVIRGQMVSGDSRQDEHLVGVATDVSDRRRAEQALLEEQEYTLAMLASMSDGVVRTDLEGRIVDLSSPAETILGRGLSEVRDRHLEDLVTFVDAETGEVLPDPISLSLQSDSPLSPPRLCILRQRDREQMTVEFHTAVLRDHLSNDIGVVLVLKDMLEQEQFERGMVYLATHDALTDLVNRTEFERRLQHSLAEARRAQRQDSILHLDLDGFKHINDTFGHPAGDKMLKQFASFLKCRFRETDTLGRLGGDRFAILLESCSAWQARDLVEKLYKDLRSYRFEWDDTALPVSLSTGLTAIDPQETDVEMVLALAEEACLLAKQQGGDRFHELPTSPHPNQDRQTQLETLHQIQIALKDGAFELHAQLIQPVLAPEAAPDLYEILPRVIDSNGDLMTTERFMPIAERHNSAAAVDRWVLTHSLEALTHWAPPPEACFCVNISGSSLNDDRFLEFVLHELSQRRITPHSLYFEISEPTSAYDLDKARRFVSVLRGRGCGFVLDNFGSGLSSFTFLRSLPVDFLKIDGRMVRDLSTDPTQRALVESINHVGHVMQLKTIAAGVENDETLQILDQIHVDYAQGDGICRPTRLEEILRQHGRESTVA